MPFDPRVGRWDVESDDVANGFVDVVVDDEFFVTTRVKCGVNVMSWKVSEAKRTTKDSH